MARIDTPTRMSVAQKAVLAAVARGDFVRSIIGYTAAQAWTAGTEYVPANIQAHATTEQMWPYVRFKVWLKGASGGPFYWAVVMRRSGDSNPTIDSASVLEQYRQEGRLFHWEFSGWTEAARAKLLDIKFRNVKPALGDVLALLVCPLVSQNVDWAAVNDYSVVSLE